jgi:predicted ATPase
VYGVGTFWRGWALVIQGQDEAGPAQMHQGMAGVLATGTTLGRPYCLVPLAAALGHTGQVAVGLRLLAEALAEAYRLHGELVLQSGVQGLESEVLTADTRRQTPDAEAEACFQQALTIARHQQAKSWELRAAVSLSRLWQQQGKRAEAYELLEPIYGWFTEGFDTADLQEAQGLLRALGGVPARPADGGPGRTWLKGSGAGP